MNATSANATNAAALAHFNGGDTHQASAVGGPIGGGLKDSGRPLRRSTLPSMPANYFVRVTLVAVTVLLLFWPWTVTVWPGLRSPSAPGTETVVEPDVLTVTTEPSASTM